MDTLTNTCDVCGKKWPMRGIRVRVCLDCKRGTNPKMPPLYDQHWALQKAVQFGPLSPCEKSKRSVIAWHTITGRWVRGVNGPPEGYVCKGKNICGELCGQLCIHAEERAMIAFINIHRDKGVPIDEVQLLHVKVVDGRGVHSGPPSCLRCSAKIVEWGFMGIWLYHDTGLRFYTPHEFHTLTLEYYGLSF